LGLNCISMKVIWCFHDMGCHMINQVILNEARMQQTHIQNIQNHD
jgi:hypothetical protein